jgi:hypothetical protein
VLNNGGMSISSARGRRKSEVTSLFESLTMVSYLVFDTHCVCKMNRLKVIPKFLIDDYGGMSISTLKGRLRLEMRSSVDRATTVFYSCFVYIYRLSCTVSTLLALLLLPKMVERRFRPLGGV